MPAPVRPWLLVAPLLVAACGSMLFDASACVLPDSERPRVFEPPPPAPPPPPPVVD